MVNKLQKYNKIFLIGICGISMSGLAILLKKLGKTVSGSDINITNTGKKLKNLNIKIFKKHKKSNVKNCDLVVFSGAISSTNPEILYAKENNIEIIERSELLKLISDMYKNVIAISGTHGKTTTTAMISYIFLLSGLNPTIHIGGDFDFINGNVHFGQNEYFITEACEFRDSFLTLCPNESVITNIEKEHLDYFKTFKKEKDSFKKFADKTKNFCFVNGNYAKLLDGCKNVVTFGLKNSNNFYLKNIRQGEDLKYIFDCYKNDVFIGTFKLNIFGKHNLENALATIAVCCEYNIDYKFIYLGLKTFNNVHRRFEYIGNYKNCPVIHDYAHHPTEIYNTIKTAKEVFKKRVVCIFQPHTYSRTKLLINKFSKCFNGLDSLYILKTYSAREKFDYFGSAEYLNKIISDSNHNFTLNGVFTKKDIIKKLNKEDFCNSVLLFLGAGDIENVCKKLLKKHK